MTPSVALERSRTGSIVPVDGPRAVDNTVPALPPRLAVIRSVILTVLVLSLSLLLQLVVVSRLQHASSQARLLDDWRETLAAGTAPAGPTDVLTNEPLRLGSPVASIEIRSIGLTEVVVEGTDAQTLYQGPGHRRDTRLPGQIGVSTIVGRRLTYGAPFGDLGELEPGDIINVTTAQGTFDFAVIDVRGDGDPLPPPPAPTASRLVLATAGGSWWAPSSVVRVDADLIGDAVVGYERLYSRTSLPAAESPMKTDTRHLWALALWLQALLLFVVLAVWAWARWGRPQTWVVLVPPIGLIGLATAGELALLIPNLI